MTVSPGTLGAVAVAAVGAVALGLAAIVGSPEPAAIVLPTAAERGEQVYARCMGCHSLDYDRTGPRHCGLVGRLAGSVADFVYSEEMKQSGITWDVESLDRFLADPAGVVPGTLMTYAGVADEGERGDLIAFLVASNADPERCGEGQ